SPLSALVGPPRASGVAWSWWRIGASQYGVRQVSSRRSMNRGSPFGNSRASDSIATNAPLRGQDEVDPDGDGNLGRPPGDPLDQGVGHDLATATPVEADVGGPPKCGVDRHALRHRQQRRQVGHGVGCRPDGDRAFGFGTDGAVDDRLGVEPIGDRLGRRGHPGIAQTRQPRDVGTQLRVQDPSVFDVQAGGLAHDQRGPPLPRAPRTPVRQGCGASRAPTPWRNRGACRRGPGNPAAPTPPHWPRPAPVWLRASRRLLPTRVAPHPVPRPPWPAPPRRPTSAAPAPRCASPAPTHRPPNRRPPIHRTCVRVYSPPTTRSRQSRRE
ncbi:MAG: hypothetical protein QOF25_2159, partial [Mycobacterium sp.]|nr:hypothetical protein [Mycobacterium sp.]